MNANFLTKEKLSEYKAMQLEIQMIKKEIKKTEDSISDLIAEGTVCDKVTGGLGGIQGFKIEGFPITLYEKRKKLLRKKVNRLRAKENDLIEYTEEIESFIDTIPMSRDRQIFKCVFIEGMTQQQIADNLSIDRSLVSKIISKYL